MVSSPGLQHSIDILAMWYMSEREFIFVESKVRKFHCLLQVVSIPTGLNICGCNSHTYIPPLVCSSQSVSLWLFPRRKPFTANFPGLCPRPLHSK